MLNYINNYIKLLSLQLVGIFIFCFSWVQAETHTVIYPSNLYPGLFWEVEQVKPTEITQQVFSDYKTATNAPRYRPLDSEERTLSISHNYRYRSEIPEELLANPDQRISEFKPGLEDIRPTPPRSFMDAPNNPNNLTNYPNTSLDPWQVSQFIYYNLMRNMPPPPVNPANPTTGNFAWPNLPMDGRFYFQPQSSSTELAPTTHSGKPSIYLLSEPFVESEQQNLSIPVERLFTVPDDWIQAPP